MAWVVVVDDDGATREVLRDALEDAGHQVVAAADTATGLAILRANPRPCVVLVDLVMPPPDGVEFLRTVAMDYVLAARHCCIAMTAGDAREMALLDEVRHLLPFPILAKPFDLDDLLAAVAAAARRL